MLVRYQILFSDSLETQSTIHFILIEVKNCRHHRSWSLSTSQDDSSSLSLLHFYFRINSHNEWHKNVNCFEFYDTESWSFNKNWNFSKSNDDWMLLLVLWFQWQKSLNGFYYFKCLWFHQKCCFLFAFGQEKRKEKIPQCAIKVNAE